jgi:hypothetical protein
MVTPSIWLLTLVAVQDPARLSHVPQRPGLTLVQAVQGDTLLGNSRGDYELAITLTAISPAGAELTASSLVRNYVGRREWLHFRRTVLMADLRFARTQILAFDTNDSRQLPGTTALGPSVAVMAEAQRSGTVEFRVRNYADRWDNPGTLRRVGVEALPVPLNGRRVTLPSLHLRGQLGPPGHLRPWSSGSWTIRCSPSLSRCPLAPRVRQSRRRRRGCGR